MFKKSFISGDVKGVSKQIRKRFAQVIETLQLDLRVQTTNRQQNLQKMYHQLKNMSTQINRFSNLLLNDDFSFKILTRYCEIMFSILTTSLTDESQKRAMSQTMKSCNENNVYEVVATVRLENFDLKEKIREIESQLGLARERAEIAEEITLGVKEETEGFLKTYQQNFGIVCDLLKKAENTQIQLLQSNRFLKQQLQSLSIQFQRYKQYFKLGPSLKQKQFRMKNQLQKEYQIKIKGAIKQVQATIKSQLERSVVEKFHLKDIKNLRIF